LSGGAARAVIARLEAASCTLRLRPDGGVTIVGPGVPPRPPPAELIAEARLQRDEIARLLLASRPTRPGLCAGDPPEPVVPNKAAVTLAKLELHGAGPSLQPDGSLGLAHPDLVTPELLEATRLHQADIGRLLAYRGELNRRWPTDPLPLATATGES
jgi:hypothetical protein